MAQWSDIPFDEATFQNEDEAILSQAMAALENGYINAAGGHSRFPGIKPFVDLGGTRTYLFEWRGNLIAATDEGRVFRINEAGETEDVTGIPISGGRRVTFTNTEDELVMAAGGPIIRLAKSKTEVLSEDAPDSTHVAFLDGYLIAIEPFSGRFRFCKPGQYRIWDALDVFAAESKPDDLISVVVTPYRELLLCGVDSIEQFEPAASGTVPFFRRWSSGDGLFPPYTMLAVKEGNFAVNKEREFVRVSQQSTSVEGNEIGLQLERVTDWREAWAALIKIKGQKFIVLQVPRAANPYGTEGLTFLYDFRGKRWQNLYAFDEGLSLPTRWPAWSYYALWGRHFIGVDGGVAELDASVFDDRGAPLRLLARTGHVEKWGRSRIDDILLRFKRGVTGSDPDPVRIGIRVRRDNGPVGPWIYKMFGRDGERDMVVRCGGGFGIAYTWQFEYQVTDPVAVEFVGAQALVEELRR